MFNKTKQKKLNDLGNISHLLKLKASIYKHFRAQVTFFISFGERISMLREILIINFIYHFYPIIFKMLRKKNRV